MSLEELIKAKEVQREKLSDLMEMCIAVGEEAVMSNSPQEFEEAACEYCREMGWTEPA